MAIVKKIAVIGAGNGGCAAAADLAARGYRVSLYSRRAETIAPIIERGGIQYEGALGQGFAEIDEVTDDIAQAAAGAQLLLITVPTTAHAFLAGELAPVIAEDQIIMLNPGHTGGSLHFAATLRKFRPKAPFKICEVYTLTYSCRLKGPARVWVGHRATNLSFASFPGKHGHELYGAVKEVYPGIVPAKNVLETSFMNINAIEHPPQTILNAGWLEHTKGDYYFYYEGTTPCVARVIEALDEERRAVAKALNIPTKTFLEFFYLSGYTTERAYRTGSVYQALQESAPNRYIKGPQSLDHRYMHEDVGMGLVPLSEFGKVARVETPIMDSLVHLASAMMRIDYRRDGLSLEKMGLGAVTKERLEDYLFEGPRMSS